jgi:DNA-binding transcriptional ArsR family regulator
MPDALRTFKAELFQALAHPTRVGLVEALQQGELAAGALIAQLGLEQANASQHLAILRAKHVVKTRRVGNQIHYSLRDPVLSEILALLRQYFYAHLAESAIMLGEVAEDKASTRN